MIQKGPETLFFHNDPYWRPVLQGPLLGVLKCLTVILGLCVIDGLQAQSDARAISVSDSNLLRECRALSIDADAIHNCMDNFLDLLDNSIADIEDLIVDELSRSERPATVLSAFERSQAAFREYRRENCLWYLEFSEGRLEATQIAKNCLATMSQQRLSELQALVTDNLDAPRVAGFYVYGAERNTFRFCDSTRRYWVEGEPVIVSQLQQNYLTQALTELAVLYVELRGVIDEEAGSPYPGHDGVFRVSDLIDIRPPSDADCALLNAPAVAVSPEPVREPLQTAQLEEPVVEPEAEDEASEQQLTAYFGAWRAECLQKGEDVGCTLSVEFDAGDASKPIPELLLYRSAGQPTALDLRYPDRTIADVDALYWRVDQFDIGVIAMSSLVVDDQVTTQRIRNRRLIEEDLLPMMKGGNTLGIAISETEKLTTTLIGLTRALAFADTFNRASGGN